MLKNLKDLPLYAKVAMGVVIALWAMAVFTGCNQDFDWHCPDCGGTFITEAMFGPGGIYDTKYQLPITTHLQCSDCEKHWDYITSGWDWVVWECHKPKHDINPDFDPCRPWPNNPQGDTIIWDAR